MYSLEGEIHSVPGHSSPTEKHVTATAKLTFMICKQHKEWQGEAVHLSVWQPMDAFQP